MADDSPKLRVLRSLKFGQRVAEDEGAELERYFVETADWRQLISGQVDVIYGQKGAGKSALYGLLLKRAEDLRKRSIYAIAAENVRGTTAFQELKSDPPPTEQEFAGLWKMYLLSLVGDLLEREGFGDADAKLVSTALRANGLMRENRSLTSLLRVVADYMKNLVRARSIEAGVAIDPHSGMPMGLNGKIVLGEPSKEEASRGIVGVGSLFEAASRSLATKERAAWILIDRLDVAFAETSQLEENALRALFKTYLDLLGNENIRLKIFLRSDIWTRITSTGFREASHITRHLTIAWDRPSILDLIVRRALANDELRAYYQAEESEVLSSAASRLTLFNRMFYDRADPGTRKSKTLDWIVTRTWDGKQVTAPREVVHLLNEVVAGQVRKLDLGEEEPEDEFLFSRSAFKEALPNVSRVRLEQTIYAEYPQLKAHIEALREEKSEQYPNSLAVIWAVDLPKAIEIAGALVDIGFFERRGSKHEPQFWIPFLYRGYLDISQGKADDPGD